MLETVGDGLAQIGTVKMSSSIYRDMRQILSKEELQHFL